MWRRNAVSNSHQTQRLQKLRLIRDAAGTHGTPRKTETKSRNCRRRKRKSPKRILEMVAKQEKVTAQRRKNSILPSAISAKRKNILQLKTGIITF
jgi:hypothetical protein